MRQQNDMGGSDICETWKALTREGNAHFHAQAYVQALACYEQSRSLLLQHFAAWDTPDNALAALTVSYLNLADTQQRLGRCNEAADTLCMAHERVMSSLHAGTQPGLREAACRHQGETFAALSQFAHAHGHDTPMAPLIAACLARTQAYMQETFAPAHPASHLH